MLAIILIHVNITGEKTIDVFWVACMFLRLFSINKMAEFSDRHMKFESGILQINAKIRKKFLPSSLYAFSLELLLMAMCSMVDELFSLILIFLHCLIVLKQRLLCNY